MPFLKICNLGRRFRVSGISDSRKGATEHSRSESSPDRWDESLSLARNIVRLIENFGKRVNTRNPGSRGSMAYIKNPLPVLTQFKLF